MIVTFALTIFGSFLLGVVSTFLFLVYNFEEVEPVKKQILNG